MKVAGIVAFLLFVGCQGVPHKHVRGGDTDTIISEYESHKDTARHCYSDYLKDNPGLEAKVVLRWTVGNNGKARDIKVVDDTLFQPSITRCLQSHLKDIHFSPTGLFRTATIEYTYNLRNEPILVR